MKLDSSTYDFEASLPSERSYVLVDASSVPIGESQCSGGVQRVPLWGRSPGDEQLDSARMIFLVWLIECSAEGNSHVFAVKLRGSSCFTRAHTKEVIQQHPS